MNTPKKTGLAGLLISSLWAALSASAAVAGDDDATAAGNAVAETRSEAGHVNADRAFAFGLTYDNGTIVPRDYSKALYWYTLAAGAGHAEAMNRLGIFYAMGHGVPQDYATAMEWYRRGAASGSTSAMNNVATAYFNGLGVPRDYSMAARWLEPVAGAGDARAQNKLALLYEYGLGVPKNRETAFKLLSRSAAQQYAPAMANLGAMYADPQSARFDAKRGTQLIEAALRLGLPDGMRETMTAQLTRWKKPPIGPVEERIRLVAD